MQKQGSLYGLSSGFLWALDTVILGVALMSATMLPIGASGSLVATFVHDGVSFFVIVLLLLKMKHFKNFTSTLKSKSGLAIIAAALLGGPIGMGAYILSIRYIGASLASSISAIYPAIGAFLAYVFLKERLKPHSKIGLGIAILAISLMGFTSDLEVTNLTLGLFFSGICVIGWGSEAVIINATLKEDVSSEVALGIRQMTSFIVYMLIVMPFVGYNNVAVVAQDFNVLGLIMISGVIGTLSFLFYYKSIDLIGATQAMGLNISYPAWAFFFHFIYFGDFNLTQFALVVVVMIGSIMSNDKPFELLQVFKLKKA